MAIDEQTRLLAAIAYGEGSTANVADEIRAIAFAAANRARAWGGKTIRQMLDADPNYTFATHGHNERYNLYMKTPEDKILGNAGMKMALDSAIDALANKGPDPSNGAYWWDGLDFKTNYAKHRKVNDGFKYGDPTHNIFNVPEKKQLVIQYWRVFNKKLNKMVNSTERGRYDSVWQSTAAYGSTIFWTHNPDFVKATGCKPYK